MTLDGTEAQLAEIATALGERLDELGYEVAQVIRSGVDFYAYTSVVSDAEIVDNCTNHIHFVASGLRSDQTFDTEAAQIAGRARAAAGVPLPALMHAYRLGFHRLWGAMYELTGSLTHISRAAVLRATQRMWDAQDAYTDAMTAAYRERAVAQILTSEAERAALTEHLLRGSVGDERTLWEIADLLRLPGRGPYLVVAARCPSVGKQALPGITDKLRSVDMYSAWRLQPDQQIGIVHFGSPTARAILLDLLSRLAQDRVGVSAAFDDLADTAQALRRARIALNSRSQRSPLTVFDDSVLAVAAVTAPDITTDLAARVLGGLFVLPADDRRILTDTFRCWVDQGGSIPEVAAQLFCHPNTVRYRLRRIEELTGRSLSHPRHVAELCLAFEIDAQLPPDAQ
jgi:PucR C-terminal helix-turn-helix domain/GGDEF-like domain